MRSVSTFHRNCPCFRKRIHPSIYSVKNSNHFKFPNWPKLENIFSLSQSEYTGVAEQSDPIKKACEPRKICKIPQRSLFLFQCGYCQDLKLSNDWGAGRCARVSRSCSWLTCKGPLKKKLGHATNSMSIASNRLLGDHLMFVWPRIALGKPSSCALACKQTTCSPFSLSVDMKNSINFPFHACLRLMSRAGWRSWLKGRGSHHGLSSYDRIMRARFCAWFKVQVRCWLGAG